MKDLKFLAYTALFAFLFTAYTPHCLSKEVSPVKEAGKQMASKEAATRRAAAAALGGINSIESARLLVKALKEEKDFSVKMAVVDSLRKLVYPETVAALCDAVVNDSNPQIRHNAVLALQQIKDPKAIPPLVRALNDPDLGVRYQAPIALGMLKANEAVDALNLLVKDQDKNMVKQVLSGIGKIKNPKSIPFVEEVLFDSNKEVQSAAVDALAKLNSIASIPKIKLLLKNADDYVRISAAESLAFMQDSSGLEAALDMLKSKDVNLQKRAIFVVGSAGDRSSLNILKKYENNSELKDVAAIAIGRIENRHPVNGGK